MLAMWLIAFLLLCAFLQNEYTRKRKFETQFAYLYNKCDPFYYGGLLLTRMKKHAKEKERNRGERERMQYSYSIFNVLR